MRPSLCLTLVAVVVAGCQSEPTRAPSHRPAAVAASPPPTLASLEALAAGLPRCDVPAIVAARGWRAHALPGVPGAVRLPPGYAPDPGGPAGAASRSRSWAAPDSGYVTAMLSTHLGGTFIIQPEGGAAAAVRLCALPLFGRLARATLLSAVLPGGRDTLFVVTLDAPVDARRELGAGAMHHRAGARDTLLAALATMRLDP